MAGQHLASYLHDHLAGASAVLELLEHLEEKSSETESRGFVSELRADIAADRRELESLMDRLGIATSAPRQAASWLAGKITEVKLHWDDPAGGAFRYFEVLELTATGIEGKRTLWVTLAALNASVPILGAVDFGHLEQRAREQRERLEPVRLKAAQAALE